MLPQYDIECLLGRGGMGAVYRGVQKNLGRPVAIKILPEVMAERDPSYAERFKNEARAMGRLSHAGIVKVFDAGDTPDGMLFIVMEFIEGTDVARMLAAQGRLKIEHAMAITAHVCDALAYAHERGIIHRDIKPANIMVGYDGVVKVADFGLAKVSEEGRSGLTQSGMAMGTLHYMAPEALMLGSAVDHRADLYAVGVMLYQMLTGSLPQGVFELPSQKVPGLDPRYDDIIRKALREDRDIRYQSAHELRRDLDSILTQPVARVEASAEKAPAALPTEARPQRSAAPPPTAASRSSAHRIPQPQPRGSGTTPLLWAAIFVLAGLAAFILYERQQKKQLTLAAAAPVPELTAETVPPTAETAPQAPPVLDSEGRVTIPAWLQEARKRGGRLKMAGTLSGVSFTPGPAAEHDDFVEVSASRTAWLAHRASGELFYGHIGQDGKEQHGRVEQVIHMSTSRALSCLDAQGQLWEITGEGMQAIQGARHPDARNHVCFDEVKLLFDAEGRLLLARATQSADSKARPTSPGAEDFLGVTSLIGTGDTLIGLRPGQPPLAWSPGGASPTELVKFPSSQVNFGQGDSPFHGLAVLCDSAGRVHCLQAVDGTPARAYNLLLPPADLPPVIRVRGGSSAAALIQGKPSFSHGVIAAQRPEGDWLAWGTPGTRKGTISKLGRAIDLDVSGTFGDSLCLWIEPLKAPAPETDIALRPPLSLDGLTAKPPAQPPLTALRVTDLLADVIPERDAALGLWSMTPEGLRAEGEVAMEKSLEFAPAVQTSSYELEIEFSSTGPIGSFYVQLPVSKEYIRCFFQGYIRGKTSVFGLQPSSHETIAEDQRQKRVEKLLIPGKRHVLICKVTPASLALWLDGEQVFEYAGDLRAFGKRVPIFNGGTREHAGVHFLPAKTTVKAGKPVTTLFHKVRLTEHPPPPGDKEAWAALKTRLLESLPKTVDTPFEAGFKALCLSYAGGLDRVAAEHRAALQSRGVGRSNETAALEEEKARVLASSISALFLPSVEENIPDSLRRLRVIYRTELARLDTERQAALAKELKAFENEALALETRLRQKKLVTDAEKVSRELKAFMSLQSDRRRPLKAFNPPAAKG